MNQGEYEALMADEINSASRKLTYSSIHRQAGRKYALDFGRDHKNPGGERVGEKEVAYWSRRDEFAELLVA